MTRIATNATMTANTSKMASTVIAHPSEMHQNTRARWSLMRRRRSWAMECRSGGGAAERVEQSTLWIRMVRLRRALALLRLVKSFAVGRTKANVNPPAPVPQITGADT
jgi:hypothetical protein